MLDDDALPSDKKLNMQKLRGALNSLRLSFTSKQDIEKVLGYEMGAIPPLLLKTQIPIIFDKSILDEEKVNVSSANPRAGIQLSSKNLVSIVNPKIEEIT